MVGDVRAAQLSLSKNPDRMSYVVFRISYPVTLIKLLTKYISIFCQDILGNKLLIN